MLLSHGTALQQCAKKVLSDSPGLVDFPVGLVDSVCDLPDGQVKFLGKTLEEIQNYRSTVRDELFGG